MGTQDAARSTAPVVQAGRDLRDALDDPDRAAAAAKLLAGAAEASIAALDRLGELHAAGVAMVPDDTETLLAAALSQLGVAGTMFAASEAVGEHGPAEPGALDEPLRRLDATVGLLTAPRPPAAGVVPLAASTSVAAAVASLERQLERTVDDIVARSTKVIGGSLTGIHDRGPAEVRKAWDTVNEKLHLDQFGGKLAKIGLRAFRGALTLLARIVPARWLTGIRAGVDRLIANVDEHGPAKAAVGAAIGADRLAALPRLDQSTLDTAKLDRGRDDLVELDAKYGRLMDMCAGIGTAIGVAAKLTLALRFTIPQLALLITGAHLLVVAGVLVLGRDHIDAGVDPAEQPGADDGAADEGRGLVRGVRTILAEATG